MGAHLHGLQDDAKAQEALLTPPWPHSPPHLLPTHGLTVRNVQISPMTAADFCQGQGPTLQPQRPLFPPPPTVPSLVVLVLAAAAAAAAGSRGRPRRAVGRAVGVGDRRKTVPAFGRDATLPLHLPDDGQVVWRGCAGRWGGAGNCCRRPTPDVNAPETPRTRPTPTRRRLRTISRRAKSMAACSASCLSCLLLFLGSASAGAGAAFLSALPPSPSDSSSSSLGGIRPTLGFCEGRWGGRRRVRGAGDAESPWAVGMHRPARPRRPPTPARLACPLPTAASSSDSSSELLGGIMPAVADCLPARVWRGQAGRASGQRHGGGRPCGRCPDASSRIPQFAPAASPQVLPSPKHNSPRRGSSSSPLLLPSSPSSRGRPRPLPLPRPLPRAMVGGGVGLKGWRL